MRHDISAHLLGIPDLPEEAFRHYGDRRIKPQGLGRLVKWATGGAIDVTGIDLSKPVVDVVEWGAGEIKQAGDWVGDELRQAGNWIDGQVKKHVPGGWATVLAVGAFAYGYFGGFEGLGGASGAAAGEAAAVTSGSGAAGVSTAGASTAASSAGGYAFTGGTSGVGGSMLGVEALSLPAAETSLYSLSGAAPSSVGGVTATAGEGMALAAPSSSALSSSAASGAGGMGAAQGVQMGSLPGMSTMGGAQGLTTAAAGGAGTVSALGTFSTAGEVGQYGIPKVSLTDGLAAKTTKDYLSPDDKQKEEEEKETKEKEQLDLTAAFGALGAMLASRDASTRGNRSFADGGAVVPDKPVATQAATQQTAVTSGMTAAAQQAGAAETIVAGKDVVATEVTAPAAVTEEKITADKAQEKVAESLTGIKAEQGVLSKEAQATAATVVPTETAVGKEAAAQGTATLVKDVADRTLQEGELVSGAAVDQKQVEAALAKTQAAQGVVSEEMTTQGQLNKLLTNFDAGNPPPWAAASMRGVTAQLAARGLGASSMAGQALVQATLESAMPIAAADAKVFEQMGLQNLSNRQQTAMVLAEQRAKFLGQEFDQNFQTKVLNAARIADIADKNFTADVTIALENARLTNTMDLQNLSNRQALILAKTAQVAALETANLNNRQQVAVENAKSFLAMDIRNLDNRQQTTLFKAKEIADSIISDTAAANAAKATNAANALEADKINAQLALSASQYNAAEKNKVAMFNRSAGDELLKFNAQEKNDRAEFNANMATQINIANAKVLADISTANTREVNAMAAVNAKNATDLSASTYAQLSQTYRDKLEQSWKTTDNELMRANEISKTTLMANATKYDADAKADAAFYASMGQLAVALLTTGGSSSVTSTATTWISDWLKGKK